MLQCHGFKIGDTYPFVGRFRVTEDGVDITDDIDFTAWNVTCQYRDPVGEVVYAVTSPFITPGEPAIDCTLPAEVSATLLPKIKYVVDIRVRDDNDVVRSTYTRVIQFLPAVSEEP